MESVQTEKSRYTEIAKEKPKKVLIDYGGQIDHIISNSLFKKLPDKIIDNLYLGNLI